MAETTPALKSKFLKQSKMRCTVCTIEIFDLINYRDHYKTSFHKLNLQRRNQELSPICYVDYDKYTQNITSVENINFECHLCKKYFNKEYKLIQHINECEKNCLTNCHKNNILIESEINGKEQLNILNVTDDPFLHLPSGTILGNKKYFQYFKQNYKKTKETQIIHTPCIKFKHNNEIQKNKIKISYAMNKIGRFRLQWSH